jgi:hypothetical protein
MLHYAFGEDDLTSAVTQGRAAVAAALQMPRDDQIAGLNDIERTYTVLAEVTGLKSGRVAAVAALDTAKLRITPILPATDRWTPQTLRTIQQFLDAERAADSMASVTAPPIHGDYWYNADGDSSTRPRRGTVSVLAIMPSGFVGAYYSEYAVLKRLQATYAARGVDFVIMTFTAGSFRNHLMPRPAAEAEVLKGWFLDYLKLPVTLAVEQSQFGYLQDGRRQGHQVTNYQNYAFIRNASLVGKDGKIRFIEMLTPDRERFWRSAIDEALKQ